MQERLSWDTHPIGAGYTPSVVSLLTGQLVWIVFCFPYNFNKHQIIPIVYNTAERY